MNHQQPDLYKPGTRLTVGSHQVVIDKYFSHGGFAQVYTCTISPAWKDKKIACLKRVTVPDKGSLGTLRKEVDAMRKLQGINCIVSYIDSHAAKSHGGQGPGYEVFVLMEYCSRKGLIDFMNTRLVNKLKEPEILTIMDNITEAIAHMHALNPVLIHRDIKIENVLIGDDGTYKLCDFGSVSNIILPPSNIEEFQLIQDDIMRNTTPQYRAPEMLDLYKRQPINEKSDIWALGVFLYKLCYYTTPFEPSSINGNTNGYNGDYAIINGIYSFPSSPPYSARLKNIIAKLLTVDPKMRPNAFQLLDEVSKMRGKSPPTIRQVLQTPQFTPMKLQAGVSNSVTGFNNSVGGNTSTSVTGAVNIYSGKGMEPAANDKALPFKYSTLKNTLTSSSKRVETPPMQSSQKDLFQSKVRSSRRPLSMYGNPDLNRMSSRESLDIKNFMNELTTEEIVDLSPSAKNETISSSMDFIKSISRQNTNSSLHTNDAGGSNGLGRQNSKSKKRSSISSIKNLLTGGSLKGQHTSSSVSNQHTRSTSLRKSSTYSNKGSGSVDLLPESNFKFKHVNNSLSDLKEMSPEAKSAHKFPNIDNDNISTNRSDITKRSSAIQGRVKTLFRNASPPPTKTAQGYGKYTESNVGESHNSKYVLDDAKYNLELQKVKSSVILPSEVLKPKKSIDSAGSRHTVSLTSLSASNSTSSKQHLTPQVSSISNYKDDQSGSHSTDQVMAEKSVSKSGLSGKRKPPPPKPKKPQYLRRPAPDSKAKKGGLLDDDLEVLETRFEMKFPSVV